MNIDNVVVAISIRGRVITLSELENNKEYREAGSYYLLNRGLVCASLTVNPAKILRLLSILDPGGPYDLTLAASSQDSEYFVLSTASHPLAVFSSISPVVTLDQFYPRHPPLVPPPPHGPPTARRS